VSHRPGRSVRQRVGAVVSAGMLLAAGCAGRPAPQLTGRFEGNGVAVTATLRDSGRDSEVAATFRPQAGFHLYSVDLPAQGIDGLGIPTVLAVRGDLVATGAPRADRPVRMLRPAGLPVELPVYPDGPVTITLPVRRTGADRVEVVVSYAACSEGRCLMPVTDQPIALRPG
jgi:hypothetical protein